MSALESKTAGAPGQTGKPDNRKFIIIGLAAALAVVLGIFIFTMATDKSADELEKMNKEVAELNKEITSMEGDNASLRDSLTGLEEQLKTKQISMTQYLERVRNVESKLSNEKKKYDQLLGKYNDLQDRYDKLLAENSELKAQNNKLIAENDSLQRVIAKLSQTVTQVNDKVTALTNTLSGTFQVKNFDVTGLDKNGKTFKKERIKTKVKKLVFEFDIVQPADAKPADGKKFTLVVSGPKGGQLVSKTFDYSAGRIKIEHETGEKLDKGKHDVKVVDDKSVDLFKGSFLVF